MPRSFATLEDDTYGVGILQFARIFAAKLIISFAELFQKRPFFICYFSPINQNLKLKKAKGEPWLSLFFFKLFPLPHITSKKVFINIVDYSCFFA